MDKVGQGYDFKDKKVVLEVGQGWTRLDKVGREREQKTRKPINDSMTIPSNDIPDVNAAIHDYYLSLPNRNEAGLLAVLRDPAKYNRVWRHMLKYACGQHDLEINDRPPPVTLRTLIP